MPSRRSDHWRQVAGLAELVDGYDAFILDVWGVLHNGIEPYPGVIDALTRLRRAGKATALLSNAPMRAGTVAERVAEIGIPRDLLGPVMSSGEEVWQGLRQRRTGGIFAGLGDRCYWMGPDRHSAMNAGLDLILVDAPEAAHFILNTGPDGLDDDATDLRPILEQAAASGVLMICANADLYVVHGGIQIVCAGRVAQIYESMGGTVSWHGKPFGSVYSACLNLLDDPDMTRVLAVGDSLRTDIQGAVNAGLDCLLVTGGVHAAEFGHRPGLGPDPGRIDQALRDGPMPNYIGPGLIW